MSMPLSSIALTANGLTCVASVPALITSKRSPARWRSRPSAICERAELWVHKNRTLAFSVIMRSLRDAHQGWVKAGLKLLYSAECVEGFFRGHLRPDGVVGRSAGGLHHATGQVAARAGDGEGGVGA